MGSKIIWIKLKPISNIRQWWRLWSIRLGTLGTIITSYLIAFPDAALFVWNLLPDDLKGFIPPQYSAFIGVAIFILALISRLIKQEKLNRVEIQNGKTENH